MVKKTITLELFDLQTKNSELPCGFNSTNFKKDKR